jgi:hypothetical protein
MTPDGEWPRCRHVTGQRELIRQLAAAEAKASSYKGPYEDKEARTVRDIVKKRCALAGLEGDFSAHSLLSGFVTDAGRQRLPLGDGRRLPDVSRPPR